MYSLVSGFVDWYFKTPTLRILIIGEESCGKTTYFEKMKEIYTGKRTPASLIIPTSGLNLTKLKYSDTEIILWDLGGRKSLRSMWEIYYSDIDGLIFMVDATCDLVPQIKILNETLDNKYIKKSEIPVLVLINKIDKEPFTKFNELNNLLDFDKLNKKNYNFMTISGVNGQGVKESMHWIYYSMCNNLFQDDDNIDPSLINA